MVRECHKFKMSNISFNFTFFFSIIVCSVMFDTVCAFNIKNNETEKKKQKSKNPSHNLIKFDVCDL